MHKGKELGVAIAILLVIFAGAFYFQRMRAKFGTSQPTATSSATAEQLVSVSAGIQDSSISPKYTISIQVPQITGLSNGQTQMAISGTINSALQNQVTSFKNDAVSAQQNPNLPANMKQLGSSLTGQCTTVQATDKIVSVQCSLSKNFPGLAHPNNTNVTWTFDGTTGKQIQLADLFKPGSNYLQRLSELSKQQIVAKLRASIPTIETFVGQGTAPQAKNFSLFTLSSESLTIVFNPAQVAPDFAGTQTVAIPYSQLTDILNPQYAP